MITNVCIPKGRRIKSCTSLQNTNSLADFVLQAKTKENKSTLLWSIPSSSPLHNHAIIRAYLIANPPFLSLSSLLTTSTKGALLKEKMLVERVEITQQSNKSAPFYSPLHTHTGALWCSPKSHWKPEQCKRHQVLLLFVLPTVYLLSKKTGLDKDYYSALLEEGLKATEGQGPA